MSNDAEQHLEALERDFEMLIQLIRRADTFETLNQWVREEDWLNWRLNQ